MAAPNAPAPSPVATQSIARLLGAQPANSTAALAPAPEANGGRLKLLGVVAGRTHRGYALISVDGKPARPFGVGSQVTDNLVLKSVAARSAALGLDAKAPASLTLELPKPPQP